MTTTTTDRKDEFRVSPRSELDFNLMTTDTLWGSGQINPVLKDKIQQFYSYVDPSTNERKVTYENLWGLLGFYTRDLRLANLSEWDGELHYVQYYIDLAGDMLQAEMIKGFLICLSRAATRLELSQSKKGFLRRRMGTLTQEHFSQEIEPKKKNFFGLNKKQE
jgi:hypothetical protein